MDYFQGVVGEFLRANRATFVNTEYLIDLDDDNGFQKGRHWYCDALAVNFSDRTVYLCEITYSKSLSALVNRLSAWSRSWPEVCAAIRQTSSLDQAWAFRPWVFIPADSRDLFKQKIAGTAFQRDSSMPPPRIETLESVAPWNYCSWDRPHAGDSDEA